MTNDAQNPGLDWVYVATGEHREIARGGEGTSHQPPVRPVAGAPTRNLARLQGFILREFHAATACRRTIRPG